MLPNQVHDPILCGQEGGVGAGGGEKRHQLRGLANSDLGLRVLWLAAFLEKGRGKRNFSCQ